MNSERGVLCVSVLKNRVSRALLSDRGRLPQYGVAEVLYFTRDLPRLTRAMLETILDSDEFNEWVAHSESVQMLRLAPADDDTDTPFWAGIPKNPVRASSLRQLLSSPPSASAPACATATTTAIPASPVEECYTPPFELPIAAAASNIRWPMPRRASAIAITHQN